MGFVSTLQLHPSPLERAKLDSKGRAKEHAKNGLSPPLEPSCIRKERHVAQMLREAIKSLVTVDNLVNFELEKRWGVCVCSHGVECSVCITVCVSVYICLGIHVHAWACLCINVYAYMSAFVWVRPCVHTIIQQ